MLCGCHSVGLIFSDISKELTWYNELTHNVRMILKFFLNHQKALAWLHEASARLTPSDSTKGFAVGHASRMGIKPQLPIYIRMASEVYVMENYSELHAALKDVVSSSGPGTFSSEAGLRPAAALPQPPLSDKPGWCTSPAPRCTRAGRFCRPPR